MQKFLALLFILVVSVATGFLGWVIGANLDASDAGFVVGFLLPTLIYYWNSQLDLNDANISDDKEEA